MSKIEQYQSLPLEAKVQMTKSRIKAWHEHWDGDVYVSFSGGKDSQVLLNIVRSIYPDIPAVISITGMDLPELVKHARTFENIIEVKPKMTFWKIVEKYGWPAISKVQAMAIDRYRNGSEQQKNYRLNGFPNGKKGCISNKWKPLKDDWISEKCCNHLKHGPLNKFTKESGLKPYIGIMADEGGARDSRPQCNINDSKYPSSAPLFFWTEKDVWQYIADNNLKLAKPYYEGETRTGCMFCMFGIQHNPGRLNYIREKYPALYRVFQVKGGEDIMSKVLECHAGTYCPTQLPLKKVKK